MAHINHNGSAWNGVGPISTNLTEKQQKKLNVLSSCRTTLKENLDKLYLELYNKRVIVDNSFNDLITKIGLLENQLTDLVDDINSLKTEKDDLTNTLVKELVIGDPEYKSLSKKYDNLTSKMNEIDPSSTLQYAVAGDVWNGSTHMSPNFFNIQGQ